MHLPYSRPRLFELADQPFCPAPIRSAVQGTLTYLWTHRFWPLQRRAPYMAVAELLDQLLQTIEDEGEGGAGKISIVDCCSGAGGPVPAIERYINESRSRRSTPAAPVQIILSDLHPNLPAWSRHARASPSRSLTYLPYSVNATHVPVEVGKRRHLRTFCLAFHHFDEDGARRILEDAMRSAEGIVIIELQEPTLGSMITVAMTGLLHFLLVPFQNPDLLTIIFTYIIPFIPLILTFDGMVSAYRSRPPGHVQYLASLASLSLSLEAEDWDAEWHWTSGRQRHTWPFGYMTWVIGRKDR